MPNKIEYLGDSVYASFDGYQIKLVTNDGLSDTNTIFLEPEVIKNLDTFITKLKQEAAQP